MWRKRRETKPLSFRRNHNNSQIRRKREPWRDMIPYLQKRYIYKKKSCETAHQTGLVLYLLSRRDKHNHSMVRSNIRTTSFIYTSWLKFTNETVNRRLHNDLRICIYAWDTHAKVDRPCFTMNNCTCLRLRQHLWEACSFGWCNMCQPVHACRN